MTVYLSILVFLPAVAGAIGLFLPKRVAPWALVLGTVLTLAYSIVALARFQSGGGLQFVTDHNWISELGIRYTLGVDGLNLFLILLTTVLWTAAALAAAVREWDRPRLFYLWFGLGEAAVLGAFTAQDLALFVVFFDLMLIPFYFLIGIWGGEKRVYATTKLVIYTLVGSLLMLAGAVALGVMSTPAGGHISFSLATLAAHPLPASSQYWIFLLFAAAFLVKAPIFPFHGWMPDAYKEAPIPVILLFSAVVSKVGVYGFLRILWPLFPAQLHAAAPCLLWLALGGVVLGAFAAMKQTDLKRMVAYSSINHLSYCLLALFAVAGATRPDAAAAALSGTLLQMFNHGLSAAALFACVGMLEARAGGKRGLDDFGGLRTVAPLFAGFCGIAMFSSLGLPGLNGFVGEFLIFRGVFGLAPWAAGVACLGLLATALFLLTFWQRVFHGPVAAGVAAFRDLDRIEFLTLLPLVVLMFLLGVLPQVVIALFNPLVTAWATHLP